MKTIIKISCALLFITMSVALLLAVVNEITRPIIQKAEAEKHEKAILQLFSDAQSINTKSDDSDFNDNIVGFYTVFDGETQIGYYAHTKVFGFKSDIEMLIGLDIDGSVCGLVIVSHSETVGIGTKIEDNSFLNEFIGKSGSLEYKKGANENGYIDGITGATYSSKAVIEAVSSALEAYKNRTIAQ